MGSIGGGVARSRTDPGSARERGLWTRQLGYVPLRTILRLGIVAYLVVVGLITLVTNDVFTILLVAVVSIVALKLVTSPRFIGPDRMVHLYEEGGVSVAVHETTDTIRHGRTPDEALAHLERALDETL